MTTYAGMQNNLEKIYQQNVSKLFMKSPVYIFNKWLIALYCTELI